MDYVKKKIEKLFSVEAIVTIHYFEFASHFRFSGEAHDFWECVYVDSGEVLATADGVLYTLHQGEILFHKPNEFHTIALPDNTAANACVFSFVCQSPAMHTFENIKMTVPENARKYIMQILREGRSTFHLPLNDTMLKCLKMKPDAPHGGIQMIGMHIEALLLSLYRVRHNENLPGSDTAPENQIVASVCTFLSENLYKKIGISDVCRKLNYSKAYLSRIFKLHIGQSIMHYYTEEKIKAAKLLLRSGLYTSVEISDMLSFDNPHYFSRVFRRITNMTPREYLHSVNK